MEPAAAPLLRPPLPTAAATPDSTALQYFDPAAIFEIPPDVLEGYYILLGGRPEADMTVAFFSILDGNVLPACFGLGPLDALQRVGGLARTRSFLSGFQGQDALERRIVFAYGTLFRLLLEYHHDLRAACWCFPPCAPCVRACLRPRYQRSTLRAINSTFASLERDLTPP